MLTRRLAFLTLLAATVAACGGSKGGLDNATGSPRPSPSPSPTPAPPPPPSSGGSAEGFWTGTTSRGYGFTLLTLEDGESWAVYGSGNIIAGVVQFHATWNGSRITGSGFDYFIAGHVRLPASVSGSYTPKRSSEGVVVSGSTSSTYVATYAPQYDQAASLQDLAGVWTLRAVSAAGTSTNRVEIDDDGTFTGSSPVCTFHGFALPRTSGKNVFNVTTTFAGGRCPFNGITIHGIGTLIRDGGVSRLTTAGLLTDKSDGFFATGTR